MTSKISDIQQHPNVEISVKNFGPIAEGTVDLRPLTVFVGPSNTGKSYFSTLVYALQGVFKSFSSFVFFSALIKELRYRLFSPASSPVKEKMERLLKKLITAEGPFKLSELPSDTRALLQNIVKHSETFGDEFRGTLLAELKNCFDVKSVSTLVRLNEERIANELMVSLKVREEHQTLWNIRMAVSDSDVIFDWGVPDRMTLTSMGRVELMDAGFAKLERWTEPAGRRYYLPAVRSGIMQSHRVMTNSLVKRATRDGLECHPEVPTFSSVIAELMEKIIRYEEDANADDDMRHLAETLESDVLSGEIRLKPSASGYPEFRYRPQGTKADMQIGHASSMVSELAPLVLLLRSGIKPGDTLIIEEPEAHLHPGAQTDIAITLARLVRAGVRVIVTTHSDWLLEQIGNLILEGELEKQVGETEGPPVFLHKEQVGCWHFQKNGRIEEIAYDRMDGIEPQEYADIAESLYNRSAELHNRLEELGLNTETVQGIDGKK